MRIDTFELQRKLGRGGMGEVWQATHIDQGVDVALKVMTSARATEPRFREAFAREVRAVAGLDHPAIVRVLDSGEVGEEAEEASQGKIRAGSPYLVMELAMGTLRDMAGQFRRWSQHRTILLRILDALAHAHARDVIHRDLKPENILLVPGPHGPTLKLADFGLAHPYRSAGDERDDEQRVSGTPRFMAPEQILGQWRDQGPWTDLYALGCLAYWLASGSPPYSGTHTEEILEAHLEHPLPPLETEVDLPERFGAWLGQLLAKHPRQRFQLAADAAFALRRIDDDSTPTNELDLSELEAPPVGESTAEGADAVDGAETLLLSETVTLPEFSGALLGSGRGHHGFELPSLPLRWEEGSSITRDQMSDHLRGVGLGLFGLRQIAVVDRVEERDLLWHTLRQIHDDLKPRAIALQGTMGVGKTRLAEWLAERSLEVGAAQIFQVRHSPIETNTHGLARLVATILRCQNLSREAIVDRIRDILSHGQGFAAEDLHDCMALTELIAPICDPNYDPEKARVHFSSPRERYALVARLLARLANGRPIVLLLDDVQWGYDTLRFVQFMLNEAPSPPPVLAILTVRDEELDTRPLEQQALRQLEKSPTSQSLEITPLREADHRRLVRTLLGLDSALVEEVVQRTRGNPLFAIQLIGDWVDRRILEATPKGFRLPEGADAALPDDIEHLLRGRIDEIAQRLDRDDPDRVWAALEIAAALGHEVELREWHPACAAAGLPAYPKAVAVLCRARLALSQPESFSFLHGAIRESLQSHAAEKSRWLRHHEQCAQTLDNLYPPGTPGIASRIGRHYARARCWDKAMEPLLTGADEARVASEFDRAYELYDRYLEALEQARPADFEDKRALNLIRRARTLIKQSALSEATELLEGIDEEILSPATLAEFLFARGILARSHGDINEGLSVAERCFEVSDAAGHQFGRIKALGLRADLLPGAGRLEEATKVSQLYMRESEQLGELNDLAAGQMQFGNIQLYLGDNIRALDYMKRARQTFEKVGNHYGVAQAENAIGEVFRYRGDTERALEYYRSALKTLNRLGVTKLGTVRFNIALCLIAEGNFAGAEPYFVQVEQALRAMGSKGYLAIALAGLAACAADRRDWESVDRHLAEARKNLDETGFAHHDMTTLAQATADAATRHGGDAQAQRAAALAEDQRRQLGQAN